MDAFGLTPAETVEFLASLPPGQRAGVEAQIDAERGRSEVKAWAKLKADAPASLLAYAQYTMPDLARSKRGSPRSRYKPALHHRALAAALEEVVKGTWPQLIITMPPRHGKSELAVKRLAPYFLGQDPYNQVMFGTYSDELAGDTGRAIREILRAPESQSIFPELVLQKGSQSADRIQTTHGGGVLLAGRGGAFNGRGAHLAIVDDPIKGRKEAESLAVRKEVWHWFNDDIRTRLLDECGRIVVIMTRWHEDDLIGRLTDPKNPEYSEEDARKWRILDLPALARAGDPLGRAVGTPLWPERFGKPYLEAIRTRNPRGFQSLYQCRPTPEDGEFFKRDWIVPYRSVAEMPKNLRYFGASDHAVSQKQDADKTCLGCGGVDEDGVIWIPPDISWGKFAADQTVELMIEHMRKRRPFVWWAEREHISQALGPFLRARMREERVFSVVEPSPSASDHQTRAQSIRGLMASGMVRFPVFAPWWTEAMDELLKFPNGRNDDFVSFLAHLGRGIDRMAPNRTAKKDPQGPARGTLAWFKQISKRSDRGAGDPFKGW
jgi:hypothetical protein